jgi:carbon storage regulator
MLVLSRKKGERIMIGRQVEVCVVSIRGDRVRLGFEAPAQVSIWRGELAPAAGDGTPRLTDSGQTDGHSSVDC